MGKRGLIWQTLIPWLIALGILVLVLILYFILNEKGIGLIDSMKNLMRFGR